MLEIILSRHAEARMQERNIHKAAVVDALTPPTSIKSGKGDKWIATKNGVRVVYAVTNGKMVVVTVTRA